MYKYGIIYVATNRVNGKQYVGKTVRPLFIRRQAHEQAARNGAKTAFYHAIRKYGADAFSWEAEKTTGTVRGKGELIHARVVADGFERPRSREVREQRAKKMRKPLLD